MNIAIKPEILSALRKHKPIPPDQIAAKLDITIEAYYALEREVKELPIAQADKLARLFNRNWAVFLLKSVPAFPRVQRDNRSTSNQKNPLGLGTLDAIDEAAYKLGFAIDLNPDFQLDLPAVDRRADPEALASQARSYVNIAIEAQEQLASADKALELWTNVVEDRGVLVLQYPLSPNDGVRAFSLHNERRAAIVLNSGDTQRGRVFSLFHELCHVLLRHTGLCDLHLAGSEDLETYSNRFASYFLIPRKEFESLVARYGGSADWNAVATVLANRFKVSRLAIFTRMRGANLISQTLYEEFHFRELAGFRRREETARPHRLDYYVARRLRNGRRLSAEVLDAISNGDVSPFAGFRVLGISGNTLAEYKSRLAGGGG